MTASTASRPRPWLLPGLMLTGAALGIALGGALGERWADPALEPLVLGLRACGTIFLSFLTALVVPLILTSVTVGVAALGAAVGRGRGAAAVTAYYLFTTLLAVALGLALVNLIAPGQHGSASLDASVREAVRPAPTTSRALYDLATGLFPPNWVAAAAEGNLLGLIVAAVLFGAVLANGTDEQQRLRSMISAVNEALLRLVKLAIWAAPVGILALVAERIGSAGGAEAVRRELYGLGAYAATVLIGLAIHAGIVLPLILRLVAGRPPMRYATGMAESLVVAFGSASSAASLGLTLRCAIEKNGVGPLAARLVIPLGATVNMNGTALYEAVAAVFIAQVAGIELSALQQGIVLLTATLAAVGAAAIPEAGLVTLLLVLSAAGLPAEGVGLLLSIDWILDRFRTSVNVWGDAVGAAVIDRWWSAEHA